MLILTTNGNVPSLPLKPSCWGAYLRTGTTLIFHLHTRHTKKKVATLVSDHYIILSWIITCKTSSSTSNVPNTTYPLVLL